MEQLLNEDVKQTLLVKVEAPEETSHGGVMEVPESTCKKEEMEEVMIGQEENHLCVKEESSAASFAVSTTSISNVTQMLLVKVEPPEQASVALEISESSYKKEEVMEDCVKEESSASSFPVSTTSINNVTQMLHVKVEAPEEKSHGVVLDVPESPYKKEEVIEAVIGQEEKQLCVKESSAASFPNSPASINTHPPTPPPRKRRRIRRRDAAAHLDQYIQSAEVREQRELEIMEEQLANETAWYQEDAASRLRQLKSMENTQQLLQRHVAMMGHLQSACYNTDSQETSGHH